MPLTVQIVVDCADPHPLAWWWAETLGWDVEPQDAAFIESMIDQGFATEGETTHFRGDLVWRTGAAITPPSALGAGAPRILFQLVPETKTLKNRVHLDLRGVENIDSYRSDLAARGAIAISEGRQGPHSWVTFVDPEGNEFCV
jgi:hypothetical protein